MLRQHVEDPTLRHEPVIAAPPKHDMSKSRCLISSFDFTYYVQVPSCQTSTRTPTAFPSADSGRKLGSVRCAPKPCVTPV